MYIWMYFTPATKPAQLYSCAPSAAPTGNTRRTTVRNGTDSAVTKKGSARVTGRRSPVSLYSEALATFEDGGAEDPYDQRDATGFIRLQGLRLVKPGGGDVG